MIRDFTPIKNMKRGAVLVLIIISVFNVNGQKKTNAKFKMPDGVEYSNGRALVKVKAEFKSEITQGGKQNVSSRIQNGALKNISPLMPAPSSSIKSTSRIGEQKVDISNYFSISFDEAENVEEYINQLYATGYFEIVEPEYKYKINYQPNDPSIGQQYYLTLIKAFDAWNITQGDTSIVIAMVDTGGSLTHPDIAPNLFRNWAEYPPNGIDDDGNGFIDDYRGWDFMGTDTLNVTKSNFIGDNDPSVFEGGEISHGTWTGGCASAATNNGIGIAGVGFKTRLMFTKHTADNQKTSSGSLYSVYSGLLYAADLFYRHSIRGIINCSFGGSGESQIIQDLINHIVLDQNCLIVAAAGNNGSSNPSYPAAYDNVLSVAATDSHDVKASFTNYGTTIDLAAPGVNIYTTGYSNVYNIVSGTSFSSPITAGAAALVWANNPNFTAIQVGEQLRVSADATSLYNANPNFIYQLGNGRLDINSALTLQLPSIRASNLKLVNQNGFVPLPGDKALLTFDFTNYLKSSSSGLQISISTTSTAVTILKGTISPGIISAGTTLSNQLTPFELSINSNAAPNSLVNILISYSDGVYSDYQYQSFYVNPTFINVTANQITTTVSGIGRIGFQDTQDDQRTQGLGFIFNQNPLLFEMGLIMGTSSSNIYNNVRGTLTSLGVLNFDEDFSSTQSIKQITPGIRTYSEISGAFSNSLTTSSQAVVVGYRSLVMKDSPYDRFVIMEYQIKNPKATALSNFYFGIYADWDISTNGANDAAAWDSNNNLGYVYPALTAAKPYAGIQVLTGKPGCYAIDNDPSFAGTNSFGVYDGYTDTEKFESISAIIGSGNERLQAGTETGGGDVSHCVTTGPYNIPSGQTITIAFALHAGANLTELQTSAQYADSLYNFTFQATKPIGDTVSVCYNSQATLNASGANTIKWYDSFTGGQSFHTGSQYSINNLKSDTTFYVSNADSSYESVRTAVVAYAKANSKITTSGSTTLCQGDTLTLSVEAADSTLWNNGLKTNSIEVNKAGLYSVISKDNTLSCVSKSDTITVATIPKPTASFSFSGTLLTEEPITFTDQSTGAISWFWNFGDGQNSTNQNPVHTYSKPTQSVKLTVVGSNGCSDTKSESVIVITAIDDQTGSVKIYPNPVGTQGLRIEIDGEAQGLSRIIIYNSIGQIVLEQKVSLSDSHAEFLIPTSSLEPGVYVLKFNLAEKLVTTKLIKTN